jgi:nicotinamidase-related amidase
MKTALIIVDVHNFFLHDAPDDLISNIVTHLKSQPYDAVAFTVFRNKSDSNFVKSLNWNKCSAGEDLEFPADFQPYITDTNVFTRAAYSAFTETSLNKYLQDQAIEKVVLCGVDTDACVLATAFSAFDNGYLIDVNFDLTYSGGDLEPEARAIMERSLMAKKHAS